MDIKIIIDDEEIELNKFVKKILSGTILGGISSLTGINKDWNQIEIKIIKK